VVTLLAWVVFPLALYLVAGGLGLLAERLTHTELPDPLVAPLGACLAVVLVTLVLQLGGAGPVMAGVLTVAATAGIVFNRRRLRARLAPGWPAVAGLVVFALYMGPVVLTGHWTWLGYNLVNDTAINFAVSDHIAQHGTAAATGEPSTRLLIINQTLSHGYPLGAHGLLAALEWLVPAPVEAVYQPFIATVAALAAMPLVWLARSLRVPGAFAALAAVVGMGANLTYQYALQGAFKELSTVLVIATAAALCRFALDQRLAAAPIALLAACLAAGVGILTAGAAGYAAGLALAALAAVAVERARLRTATLGRAAVVGAAVLIVAAAPVMADALEFARSGTQVFADTDPDLSAPLTSPEVLGHLARPLPLYQSLGSWLRGDYRYPIEPGLERTLTTVLLVVAGAMLAFALFSEGRRRRLGVLLAVAPALLVYLVGAARLDPYAEAKLLVVLSPMLVFGAMIGAWWLYGRVRAAGIVAAVVVAGGVLGSDGIAYHDVRVAPVDRLEGLRDAARHAGGGEWLLPEWEELAKHFGKPAAINVGPESFSPRAADPRDGRGIFNRSFDLDELTFDYVASWPGIVLRRSPAASRPPANYERIYGNHWYELWKRRDEPQVREHLPLQRDGQPAAIPRCQDVRALAGRARPGENLVAARRLALPTLAARLPPLPGMTRPTRIPLWQWHADVPGAIVPAGQGILGGSLRLDGGAYRVWVRGGGGRPLAVAVDGRRVGAVQELNTPGQWLLIGEVELAPGSHAIELARPGGGLEPGNGFPGLVGGVALEPQTDRSLVTVRPSQAERLCGRTWDWIERVRGAARP
jgi:hypothetical protein